MRSLHDNRADVAQIKSIRPRAAVRAVTPQALADVALIDGPTAAAAACMGMSKWHDLVRSGKAPQPVIQRPRCTRWRLADVRAWLVAMSAGTGA